jgi:hypothetical protein
MRMVRGTVNAILMVTLIKPVVRLMVSRWRRQVQESPAAAMGLPVQELLETALLEELGANTAEIDAEETAEATVELQQGRSTIRTLLFVGALAAMSTGMAVVVTRLIRRRREAQKAEERELVAVPVETTAEAIGNEAEEAFVG